MLCVIWVIKDFGVSKFIVGLVYVDRLVSKF